MWLEDYASNPYVVSLATYTKNIVEWVSMCAIYSLVSW